MESTQNGKETCTLIHSHSLSHTHIYILLPLALQPTVGFGLSKNVLPFFLSATNSDHHLTPSTWRSLSPTFFHLFLGLPLLLVPSSSWVKICLCILSSPILTWWPIQPLLYPFIHSTIFSHLFISSRSRFVRHFPSPFFICRAIYSSQYFPFKNQQSLFFFLRHCPCFRSIRHYRSY